MDWRETIKISKIDAARSQIDTAVYLYFDYGDPVSIHTLATASFEILRDLDKHGSNTGTFYDYLAQSIQPDYYKVAIETLREAQNFFKHANRDPKATLEFSLAEPEIFLLGACDKFRSVAGHRTGEMGLFITWFRMQNPGMVVFDSTAPVPEFPADFKFESHQRREFFATFIEPMRSMAASLDAGKPNL